MKIRRIIEIIPTFVLIAIYFYSLSLRMSGGAWNTAFVISITGLSFYIPVISFIEAMVNSSRNLKYKKQNKLFYGYMITVWIISLIAAMFSM
ncbi:LasU family protein [Companilactobacillus huachuanensis]|uniref:LasU family protein n=1 Tax=Companilactobacillus huachuanensis TaxID=2559914 RepID=A0ABW1RNM3_9LACO|nr:LasU family protein [Companilactobacillus huachuanensis]